MADKMFCRGRIAVILFARFRDRNSTADQSPDFELQLAQYRIMGGQKRKVLDERWFAGICGFGHGLAAAWVSLVSRGASVARGACF